MQPPAYFFMSKVKTNTLKNYVFAYLPALLWALVIFFLSNQEVLPGFTVSLLDFIFKKAAHMFVYAVLYLLLFRAYFLTQKARKNAKWQYLVPIILCLFYAISDELHQSFVPGRHPSPRDLAYDLLGVTTILLYQLKII